MGPLVLRVLAEAKELGGDTERTVPTHALLLPLLEDARSVGGAAEVLHLHLLELAGSEDEVPGRDLVPEGLADLRDAEGQPLPGRLLHVLEVHIDGLRRLGTEPGDRRVLLHRSDEGLEHQVEAPRIGELALAAVRAGDGREVEPLRPPGVHERVAIRQVVDAKALAAIAAIDERFDEDLEVSRGLTTAQMHMYSGVGAH